MIGNASGWVGSLARRLGFSSGAPLATNGGVVQQLPSKRPVVREVSRQDLDQAVAKAIAARPRSISGAQVQELSPGQPRRRGSEGSVLQGESLAQFLESTPEGKYLKGVPHHSTGAKLDASEEAAYAQHAENVRQTVRDLISGYRPGIFFSDTVSVETMLSGLTKQQVLQLAKDVESRLTPPADDDEEGPLPPLPSAEEDVDAQSPVAEKPSTTAAWVSGRAFACEQMQVQAVMVDPKAEEAAARTLLAMLQSTTGAMAKRDPSTLELMKGLLEKCAPEELQGDRLKGAFEPVLKGRSREELGRLARSLDEFAAKIGQSSQADERFLRRVQAVQQLLSALGSRLEGAKSLVQQLSLAAPGQQIVAPSGVRAQLRLWMQDETARREFASTFGHVLGTMTPEERAYVKRGVSELQGNDGAPDARAKSSDPFLDKALRALSFLLDPPPQKPVTGQAPSPEVEPPPRKLSSREGPVSARPTTAKRPAAQRPDAAAIMRRELGLFIRVPTSEMSAQTYFSARFAHASPAELRLFANQVEHELFAADGGAGSRKQARLTELLKLATAQQLPVPDLPAAVAAESGPKVRQDGNPMRAARPERQRASGLEQAFEQQLSEEMDLTGAGKVFEGLQEALQHSATGGRVGLSADDRGGAAQAPSSTGDITQVARDFANNKQRPVIIANATGGVLVQPGERGKIFQYDDFDGVAAAYQDSAEKDSTPIVVIARGPNQFEATVSLDSSLQEPVTEQAQSPAVASPPRQRSRREGPVNARPTVVKQPAVPLPDAAAVMRRELDLFIRLPASGMSAREYFSERFAHAPAAELQLFTKQMDALLSELDDQLFAADGDAGAAEVARKQARLMELRELATAQQLPAHALPPAMAANSGLSVQEGGRGMLAEFRARQLFEDMELTGAGKLHKSLQEAFVQSAGGQAKASNPSPRAQGEAAAAPGTDITEVARNFAKQQNRPVIIVADAQGVLVQPGENGKILRYDDFDGVAAAYQDSAKKGVTPIVVVAHGPNQFEATVGIAAE